MIILAMNNRVCMHGVVSPKPLYFSTLRVVTECHLSCQTTCSEAAKATVIRVSVAYRAAVVGPCGLAWVASVQFCLHNTLAQGLFAAILW